MPQERPEIDLGAVAMGLRKEFGSGKPMSREIHPPDEPKYFLIRNFLGERDMLVIFNTPACAFADKCTNCNLPVNSLARQGVIFTSNNISQQFEKVAVELKHSLATVERLTLSNDGSVLDQTTFPTESLFNIARFANTFKNIRRLVLETRMEFVDADIIREIQHTAPLAKVDILNGFETLDEKIKVDMLGKEPVGIFLKGLDKVASAASLFTGYVMYKPSYVADMTDDEAYLEARRSINFLEKECGRRNLDLTIRLNPTYEAEGKPWVAKAREYNWSPPRLSDVLTLATDMRKQRVKIYLGLSSENLADERGTYAGREDYTKELLREAIQFNSNSNYIPQLV